MHDYSDIRDTQAIRYAEKVYPETSWSKLNEELREEFREEAISRYLNNFILGMLCGTYDGIVGAIKRGFREVFGIELLTTDIKVLYDELENPTRKCISVHVDTGGKHYESIIRNLNYSMGLRE